MAHQRLSSSAFKPGNRGVIVGPLLIVKNTEVIVGKKISRLDTDDFSVCLHRIFNPVRAFIGMRKVWASWKVLGL
jgi:hypothetical protein